MMIMFIMLIVLLIIVTLSSSLISSLQNCKTRHITLSSLANKQKLILLLCTSANKNRDMEEALDKIDIEKIKMMKEELSVRRRAQDIEIMKINAKHIRINQSREMEAMKIQLEHARLLETSRFNSISLLERSRFNSISFILAGFVIAAFIIFSFQLKQGLIGLR